MVAASHTAAPAHPERARTAATVGGAVMLVSMTGLLPVAETALAAAVAMVLTGCVSMEDAYESVEWHVIFLVAGLLPIGFAAMDTGLAAQLALLLGGVVGTGSPLLAMTVVFVVTVGVTQVLGGQVSALRVGPIALELAHATGAALPPMALVVAIGASTAFLTPVAHPINAMIIWTGGYRPADFVRVGTGMTLVTLVALLATLRLVWGVG